MKVQDLLKPDGRVAGTLENSPNDEKCSIGLWPDPLASEAFHGVSGEIVHLLEPHTEADSAAVLTQFLVAFGNMIGRKPHFLVEADQHFTNLFAVIVGATAKGRKGTSWGQVRRLVGAVDSDWMEERIPAGLSSGEGLIWAVRDPIHKHEPIKEKGGRVVEYQNVVADPGVADKRLLVVEAEFASPLRVIRREGNNLSPLIRQAWDTGHLRTLTKNNPATATDAHISIIGHITKSELLRHLDSVEVGNGFANRFLWICAKRSKLLPDGGRFDESDSRPTQHRLTRVMTFARGVERMERDGAARRIWREVYEQLSEGHASLFGAIISRAEAQVLRLSCIYALLDSSAVIRTEHLQAALAVWEYAEASARFIFGDALGDPVADEILRALRQSSAGLTRTEIRDLFGRNKPGLQILRALATLQEHGLAQFATEPTEGRPAERWFASRPLQGNSDAGASAEEERS